MWCAYAFAALAVISLPSARRFRDTCRIASWISQSFLQLVLLSIILVANLQIAGADARVQATHEDADAVLCTALEIQEHMEGQDREITQILEKVRALRT
jgi:hypothetical protein